MKIIALMAIIIASSHFSFAQAELNLGEPYTAIEGKLKFYTIIENSIHSVKIRDNRDIYAQKIDKNTLKETSSKMHEKVLGKDAIPFQLEAIDNKCYVFFAREEKKETMSINCIIIDLLNLSIVEQKVLHTIEGGIYRGWYVPICKFALSQDKSKILIQYQKTLPRDRMSEQTFGFHIFDPQLNKLGGGEVKMPFRWDAMDDMDYSVQNNGNIHLIGYNNNDNEYHLVKINKDDMSLDFIKTKDKNFSYFYEYATNSNDKKIVAGFYSNGESKMQMFTINLLNGEKSEVDIPSDLIPYYKDKGEFMNSIMALDAFVQEDGGVLVIGQELYGQELYGNWNNGARKSYASQSTYNFNDYYLIRTNADGTLKWAKRINKETKNLTNSSGGIDDPALKILKFHPRLRFHYFIEDGFHYLLFDDEIKEYKGKMMCAYKVEDSSGKGQVTIGFNTEKIDKKKVYHVKPDKTLLLGNNQVAAEGYKKGNGDYMIKFEVK